MRLMEALIIKSEELQLCYVHGHARLMHEGKVLPPENYDHDQYQKTLDIVFDKYWNSKTPIKLHQ